MSGVTFAKGFVPFAKEQGIDIGNIHIIRQNPEQSKHLETATVSILGANVDFVNLRSEVYCEDSRIPLQMV